MRFKASALGGLLTLAALVIPIGPSAAAAVMGYPRCNLEGVTADYTWWSGDEHVAITSEPQLEWDGIVVDAYEVDCTGVVECLRQRPEMAGKAASFLAEEGGGQLVGTNGPDLIVGGPGADRITGRRGRDTICGGQGNDVLRGGLGEDWLSGGVGDDVVYGGPHSDVVVGGNGRDALYGGGGDDFMRGGYGGDAIYGEAGADRLRGGPSRNVCFGGPDDDEFAACAVAAPDGVEYGSGPLNTFRLEIDPLINQSFALTAAYVDWVLSDERSWIGDGSVTWRRVGAGESPDLTIILAAPETVDAICRPLDTGGYFSCRNGDTIGINVDRWRTATDWWPASLHVYRTYVINHEVGHFLGHGHTSCPGPGRLADVMQQQTKTLDGCVANGWVFPEAGQ